MSAVGWVGSSGVGVVTTPEPGGTPVGHDPMRMCELLAGLGEVDVLGVDHGVGGEPLMLHVRCRAPRPLCAG